MTFRQLEENINKWTLELEDLEQVFINQATQVNAWDQLLIKNGDKIISLNENVATVRLDQQRLEHELDFVAGQQSELEEILKPLEASLSNTGNYDTEREKIYSVSSGKLSVDVTNGLSLVGGESGRTVVADGRGFEGNNFPPEH